MDPRKVWNVIGSMLLNSKPIKDTPDLLVTDRGTNSDYQNIADEFNKFFAQLAQISQIIFQIRPLSLFLPI